MANARRVFLRNAAALTSLGLAARFDLVNLVASAHAQSAPPDYKALVCVFMFGGNDGNNTVIPLDNAGYGAYSAVRTAASGIQLPQSSLLAVQPANTAVPYGLHPALAELKTLFNERRLAILANVGTLTQPTTRASYNAGTRPQSLYSHADQQAQWQSAISDAPSATGWGGRMADQVAPMNASSGFPVITSLDGAVLYANGGTAAALSIPVSGAFALQGFGSGAIPAARLAAVNSLLAQGSSNTFVDAARATGRQALAFSATVNPILSGASATVDPLFSSLNSSIASQLHQVAKMIAARGTTGARRQVFFVQLGSFDTHGDQLNRQQALFAQLSPALKAFYDATAALGVSREVTTFTLSDFGRTFLPASGGGTDHAWGSHHFILGDAVGGGMMYGAYPHLAVGGPDDAENEGRWIPTTSVEQYGATLAQWFGVPAQSLGAVFPNLAAFATPTVGFLG
jgi:uncharacterized protein (DUF1501 family)